jgi:hypothetical protein
MGDIWVWLLAMLVVVAVVLGAMNFAYLAGLRDGRDAAETRHRTKRGIW